MDRKTFDLNQGGKCQFVSLEFWGVSQGGIEWSKMEHGMTLFVLSVSCEVYRTKHI